MNRRLLAVAPAREGAIVATPALADDEAPAFAAGVRDALAVLLPARRRELSAAARDGCALLVWF